MFSAISGLFLPFHGLRLIAAPGLRRFVIVPLLVNLIIFAALAVLGAHLFEGVLTAWLPDAGWLSYLRSLFWLLFALAYLLILFFGFTLLANLIAAPFNSLLAARVEEKLTGAPPPKDPTSLLKTLGPALAAEVGKFLYLVSRAIPLLVLMLVPGLNVLASIGWLIFGAWFLAVEYGDYPMANHAIAPSAQRRYLRGRRVKSLAFGAGVAVLMLIPVLQLAAMPAAVAAATRLWVDDLKTDSPS